MDTTMFTANTMDACGAYCMDAVTAGLILLATVAIMVIGAIYTFAGICKRFR